jgi:hypothetical protein
MTKEQKIDKIVKDLPIKELRNKMTDAEWHGWFLECWNEAINFTHCCTQLLCLYDDFNFLTKGKTYEMVSEPDGHYVVIDDFGEERLLWKKYFKILN